MRRITLALAFWLALAGSSWATECPAGEQCNARITAVGATCASPNAVILNLTGAAGSATVSLGGTFVATLQFLQSADNKGSWVGISGYPQPTGATATAATAIGTWRFAVGGSTQLCVRASAYTNGPVEVTMNQSPASASSLGPVGTAGGDLSGTYPDPTVTALVMADFNNQIFTSAVDANGNPAFLTAGAGLVLNILGGTTPVVLFNHGKWQTLTSNVTLTLTAASNQFVYVTQDLTNPALVAADFGASALPPDYDYVAPGAPAADQHWFDLSRNQMYRYSGAAWVAVNRIFIGVARTSGAAIDGVICEPYRLSPQKRFELFGDASDGILEVVGATTVDGFKQYSFVRVDAGGTLQPAPRGSSVFTQGIRYRSQNAILIINGGTVSGTGLGSAGNAAPGTGAGSAGNSGGEQGAGTGGGGGGSSANAGGLGGGLYSFTYVSPLRGGTAGAINTAGGNGTSGTDAGGGVTTVPSPLSMLGWAQMNGGTGGNGAGDGANNGGAGGVGGHTIRLDAPSILIGAGSSVVADGRAGSPGAGGNAGGGGGGGGGSVILEAGFVSNVGTLTANGALGGAGVGTGGAGGKGGAGTALAVRLR